MIEDISAGERTLFEWISQILDALESALPDFAAQAAELVYKAHPEVSTLFERRQVKALQQEIRQVATDKAAQLIGQLANEEMWILAPSRKVREHLHDHPKVWKTLQQLSGELDRVLENYGYPPRLGPNGKYFEQTRLLSAEQLPNRDQLKLLSMQYWMALTRFRSQQINHLRQEQAAHERKLDEMWHH